MDRMPKAIRLQGPLEYSLVWMRGNRFPIWRISHNGEWLQDSVEYDTGEVVYRCHMFETQKPTDVVVTTMVVNDSTELPLSQTISHGYKEYMTEDGLVKCALLNRKGCKLTYWVFDGGHYWETPEGNHFYKSDDDTILETILVENVAKELDWSKATIFDPDSPAGWLDPDGRFYGCEDTYQHGALCYWYFDTWEGDLEKRGWVRLKGKPKIEDGHDWGYYFCNGGSFANRWVARRQMTPLQKKFLSDRGHLIKDDE